jgi:hypothetical protein
MIGVSIAPAISYNLSEKFALEASFGSLGYSSFTSKETEQDETGDDIEIKETFSGIDFSLDMTSLSFGAIFKF